MGPRRNRQETAQVASGQARKTPGGGGGGGVSRPWRRPIYSGDREDFWQKQFKNVRHQERGMMSNPDHRTFWLSEPIGFYRPLQSSLLHPFQRQDSCFSHFSAKPIELQQGRSQFVRATGAVPLRLRISSLKLAPGEKAHFVVDSGATYDWALINQVRNDPSGRLKSMLDIPLVKGQEIPVVAKFFTDYTQPGSDPVTVRTTSLTLRESAGPNWKT